MHSLLLIWLSDRMPVETFKAGTRDQGLIYLDTRMASRRTLMGPILGKRGLEQGAVNSDRKYKLVNNSQLCEAQSSGLVVDVGGVHVACDGEEDDVALLTPSRVGQKAIECKLYLFYGWMSLIYI